MTKKSVLKKRAMTYGIAIAAIATAASLVIGLILALTTPLPAWAIVLITVAAGALCACGVGYPLINTLVMSIAGPVAGLRDAAVKIAGGALDTKASEKGPGELGQLGKAINNLSFQLSRNMYQLILERNRLKGMLDNLSEGIIAVDHEGRITHHNPAVDALMCAGNRLSDMKLHRMDSGKIWADFKRTIETGEIVDRTIDMKAKVVRVVISPIIDETGSSAGAVGLFSDITQQERLERTRRDYVANVSHEMRTPLTAVRALIEPLKEGMVTDEAARMRYYDIILREVMRLSRLIADLMELSRLQSGTLAIEKQSMKLDDLMYDVCDRYSSIAQEHGLSFDVKGDFSELPTVFTNADRVEQMMVILLDNAIKYTEEGGLTVSARYDDDKVTVSVADTGVGIDSEDLPYVFDRFYKVDKAHSGKGSGLGLSIARELWNWMGEELTVTSEKGKGSCFSFTVSRKKETGAEDEE
jgi:PAS domain S-box-containing protein